MSLNDRVIQKIESVLHEDGGGSAGSRNLSGTTSYHAELEKEVAELFHKDSALLFTSGYVANMATISTLAKIIPDIVFISDEKNHASIINASEPRNSWNLPRPSRQADSSLVYPIGWTAGRWDFNSFNRGLHYF